MTEIIEIKTNKRVEFIDITDKLNALIRSSFKKDGICFIHIPHTTAAITINENADPDVTDDIINKINRLVPASDSYFHVEGNSDAHIKSSLFGQTLNLMIEGGKLLLGTWQGVYFCEFDGPRTRKVHVKFLQ
ncbi:MAG: secondary thiamine-phosphate synthase enzyme YjbQ [Actinobacteria bacterium]|nr:secondary thiamine-phosphate synthase enzyme YjbQ [Actinomycetota bacterium]